VLQLKAEIFNKWEKQKMNWLKKASDSLLALVFLAVTLYGIAADSLWVWTLAPLGIILSFTAPVMFKSGFVASLARIVIICVTIAWAGSWWIFYSAQKPLLAPTQSTISSGELK
jgi:hypothetical protein